MAPPSLADAIIVIILLIPGFMAFTLIRWLGHYGSKLSEFKITVTSFSLSMIILFFYTQIIGVSDVDVLRDRFFVTENYLILFGITLGVGGSIGIILRKRRTNYNRLGIWQRRITDYTVSPWIIVFTKNDKEYKGKLTGAGIESGEEKEIVIDQPKQIVRDKQCNVLSEIEFGKRMIFKHDDILRISFLELPADVNHTTDKKNISD